MVPLTKALGDAARQEAGAQQLFLEVLLLSDVYVPRIATDPQEAADTFDAYGFLTVSFDDTEILPIFSEQEFVAAWAGRDLPCEAKAFPTLLAVLRDNVVLHLNPGQEYGKEFSTWEIERLRRGKAAIPEILAELEAAPGGLEVEVDSSPTLYPEVKSALMSVLEIYEGVREAFLIQIRELGATDPLPVIGLRVEGMSPERLRILHEELTQTAARHLPPRLQLVIFDDLGTGPNDPLFEDAVPFFPPPPPLPSKSPRGKSGEQE